MTSFTPSPIEFQLGLATLLSGGHLLIEDVPGTGKSSLARAMAQALGLDTRRIQCTNELLPSDLLGYVSWDANTQTSRLVKGPVFTELLMVDELNRAPSKTQSALLEAMEERQVTLDGESCSLPAAFAVIATQNPREQVGVYSLPESQLDRFSICISMPSHDRHALIRMMREPDQSDDTVSALKALMHGRSLSEAKSVVGRVHISDAVLGYMLGLVEAIESELGINLAIRFRKQLLGLCKAFAYLQSRDFVAPDDLLPLLGPALRHRLHRFSVDELREFLSTISQKVQCP